MTESSQAPVKKGLISYLMKAISALPLGVSRALGRGLGNLLWWFNSREAKVTRRNLELCFPDMSQGERHSLAKQSLCETMMMLMETPAVWMRDMAWLHSKILEVEGLPLLQDSLAEGKGLIIIAPHLGNWEVVGLHAAQFGNMTSLYAPPKNAEVGAIIQASRQKSGASLVPTDRRGVLSLLKSLKAGGISGILPDQVPIDGAGELVEFYQRPAMTMGLLCNLLQKTGCRAVLSYAARVPGGFRLVYKAPHPDIFSDDMQQSMLGLNRTVEMAIADIPSQYQWEYKRYKRSLPNRQGPYKNLK
ncbi:MAG: lysophospholipid acyltransferase family protein [Cellvibrionaceae bacterium]|nr:lysophospholipid acyltransferase family protein [Cellvibrionaceae bacterium]